MYGLQEVIYLFRKEKSENVFQLLVKHVELVDKFKMKPLLLLCCFNFILSPDTNSITNYVPVEVMIPSGSQSNKLKVEYCELVIF